MTRPRGLYLVRRRDIIAPGRNTAIAHRLFFLAVLLLFSGPALAAELFGKVVGVADGDTLTILDSNRNQHRVRLAGVDAPERRQSYGERARQHLAALVYQKNVRVEWDKRDRYGRLIARVFAAECEECPHSKDVGLEQIKAGLAWHYKAYEREQPAWQRARYAASELQARLRGDGLWSDAQPVAPWDFRRG